VSHEDLSYEPRQGSRHLTHRDADWAGLRILVAGLGVSGFAAADALSERGALVTAVSADATPAIGERARILEILDVDVRLGPEHLVDVPEGIELVVTSPGFHPDHPLLLSAAARGIPVWGEVELAWRMRAQSGAAPWITITGTNGKTTTVKMLACILQAAGLRATSAGNVGTPVCDLAGAIGADATVVCEASSFQLEDSVAFAPECAILLNLSPDHLDRHGTFERYTQAKLSMFARQVAGDTAVIGPTVTLPIPGAAQKFVADTGDIPVDAIAMRGAHNLENAAVAAIAALQFNVPAKAINETLQTFTGVEHRMEAVAEQNGVVYINDSKATNVAAARAALESFDGGVHAILGGSLKGERFTGLAPAIERAARHVYLIGQAAPQLAEDLAAVHVPVTLSETLETAVDQAARSAVAGETVLLTPACASFDQFKNYEDRGDRFKKLVHDRPGGGAGKR